MYDTSRGIMDSIHNTDIRDSEIRSSKPIIVDSTNSSRKRLNDSFEPGDGVPRSIPGGKTLESNAGKILDLDTPQILFHKSHNNYMV